MGKVKYQLFVLLGLFVCTSVQAQNEKIEKEFKQIQAAYKNIEFLSYKVQYLYAYEKTPSIYIDTVDGSYRLNQSRYWGMLDGIEYIQNDSFFISIYPEEKVMLLNSASPALLQANSNWDSIWKKQQGKLAVSMNVTESLTKIEMKYLNDSVYKRIELWYSNESYLMEKMIYVMRQPQELSEEDNDAIVKNVNEFVIIEVRFSEYNNSPFEMSLLQTGRYIERKGKEYLPSKRYAEYTVLVGSPNLVN